MYQIIRFYQNGNNEIIETLNTLEEAQSHCKDPETSSQTCKLEENIMITRLNGPWFDGYREV